MAIYFNAASIHIIETHQKFDQRCLSSSSWSYDRNFLTFFDIDGEVIDDRLIFVISEVYMFKCYISSKCINRYRVFFNFDFFLFFQEFKDTFCRCCGCLHHVTYLC